MTNSRSDRNLLYGILALQMDFITPDGLIKALQAWMLSKDRSLGELLVELDQMTASQRNLLDPLVDEHIRHHGGNPQESLQSLGSIEMVAAELRSLSDPDVHASVVQVPEPDPLEAGSISRAEPVVIEGAESGPETATLPYPSHSEPRFRVLRFHAQGGLGRVSIAVDAEFQRRVAFKEIKPPHQWNPNVQQQFVLEAKTTGRLEHPSIVPVYGMGQLDDGRPFYAMRFIEGDTFKSRIADFHDGQDESTHLQRRTLRRLLDRFLDICSALQYAHAQGVFHRDLKPSNMMLGRFGETLLVDWGVAKTPRDGKWGNITEKEDIHPPSRLGSTRIPLSLVGTAQYMSPEQASGEVDKHDAATDVFGLGATLYHLLTGSPPYEGENQDEILSLASHARFVAPIDKNPDTPPGLNATCIKAMARRKEDRFQSVVELRDAIRIWLDDEPLAGLRTQVDHFEKLNDQNPDVAEYQERLGRELTGLSKVLQSLGRPAEAVEAVSKAVSLLDALFRADETDLLHYKELYFARTQWSEALEAAKCSKQAKKVAQRTRADFRSIISAGRESRIPKQELVTLTLHAGFSPEEAQRLISVHPESPQEPPSTVIPHIPNEGWRKAFQTSFGNRYALVEVLGHGASGLIYRATDTMLPRHVALKTIREGSENQFDHYLLREAAVLSALHHPHILPVYDVGFQADGGVPFFTMPLVEGAEWNASCLELPASRRLRMTFWRRMLRVCRDVCHALHYAHEQGVIHCDPKPHNVLVDNDGHGWLIDWGICHILDPSAWHLASDVLRDDLFETHVEGQIKGTPGFMSPEQARGEEPDQRTDIFVLGAGLFYILTGGVSPHRVVSGKEEVWLIIEAALTLETPPHARHFNSAIPRKLDAICFRAMAGNRDDRYNTALEFASDIERWLG